METKCIVCGIPLEEICETCKEVLREKYPNKKKFQEMLQWHKNHTKELNE